MQPVLRPARMCDAKKIHGLLMECSAEGLLLPRSLSNLYGQIRDFRILDTSGGEIIGFQPDGYVLVDLSVFEQLVDTMGGVTFTVPVDMHYSDPSQNLTIDLSAGEQHLSGEQAMQVVRFRSGYAMQDLGRVETQRAFLSAAIKQWTSFKGLVHLPAALKLVSDASKTSLTARELIWLCEWALLCSRGEIQTRTLPGQASYIAGGSYNVLDAAGVCETINACCNPYEQAIAVSNLYIRVG